MAIGSATRGRIVDSAAALFHEKGYTATSLALVADRAGVRGGSLYHFFRTKEELLGAALGRYGELLGPIILAPAFAGSVDPLERIFLVLGRYRELLLETDFGLGCPIGKIASEMAEVGPELVARIVANFDLWAGAIERCLDDAAHQLPPNLDRRRLARFVLTVMEGAVLLARGHRDIRPFDDAVAELKDHFHRLAPPAR
jgi:AcrR family transcriptional regulator